VGSPRRPFRAGKLPKVGPFTKQPLPPDAGPVEQMWSDGKHSVLVTSFMIGKQRWIHLAIQRIDRAKLTDHWNTLMRIKDLLLGAEMEAVELHPARSRFVDDGNHYHLWCPVGIRFPFGLKP